MSTLALSRDGATVGTLELTSKPPKLELVNREANALLRETCGSSARRELVVSHLATVGGKDALLTVSARKGSPTCPNVVRLAFAIRRPESSPRPCGS